MNTGPIMIVHFIKLINKADSSISEHQCSTFERPFSGLGVPPDGRRETTRGSSFSGRVDCPMECLFDGFQELRFCGSRVSEQKHVYVTPGSVILLFLLNASEHRQTERGFYVIMFVDRGCD